MLRKNNNLGLGLDILANSCIMDFVELIKEQKMSIEELLLDTGKSLENEMTEFEKKCYGMSEAAIREQYMNSFTARHSGGLEMVVMGIMSDCQEMLVMDRRYTFEVADRSEAVRQQLNVAKFILSEMMEARIKVGMEYAQEETE
jgi:hypothetical protein